MTNINTEQDILQLVKSKRGQCSLVDNYVMVSKPPQTNLWYFCTADYCMYYCITADMFGNTDIFVVS